MPGLEGSLNFHTGHTALKTNGRKFSGDQEGRRKWEMSILILIEPWPGNNQGKEQLGQ